MPAKFLGLEMSISCHAHTEMERKPKWCQLTDTCTNEYTLTQTNCSCAFSNVSQIKKPYNSTNFKIKSEQTIFGADTNDWR